MADESKNGLGVSWFIAGGFLLIVIIAVVAAVVVLPSDNADSDHTDPAGSAGESPSPSASPGTVAQGNESTGEDRQCDLDEADSDFPTRAPEFRWEDHPIGLTVPVSEEHGPVVRDGAFWRCTSRTVSGAVFAGPALLSAFQAGHQEAAADSPRARMVFESQPEDSAVDAVLRGFRVSSSNEDAAVIEYLTETFDGEYRGAMQIHLVWDEDLQDWRLDLSDGEPPFSIVEDTSGFTEWR